MTKLTLKEVFELIQYCREKKLRLYKCTCNYFNPLAEFVVADYWVKDDWKECIEKFSKEKLKEREERIEKYPDDFRRIF